MWTFAHRGAPAITLTVVLVCSFVAHADDDAATPADELYMPPEPTHPAEFAGYVMELAERAEISEKHGNHAAAIQYYAALARVDPTRAVSYRKMCRNYQAMGDYENAVEACRATLGADGAEFSDYDAFATLLLASPAQLTQEELADLDSVVAHLEAEVDDPRLAVSLACRVALKIEDERRLERCVSELEKTAPNDPETIVNAWALAVLKGDRDGAEEIVERAREAGVSPDAIQTMQSKLDTLLGGQSSKGLPIVTWRLTLGAAVVILLVLVVLYFRRNVAT